MLRVDTDDLTKNQTITFEARMFAERHRDDFFQCPRNSLAMLQRCLDCTPRGVDPQKEPHKVFNSETFESAFRQLTAEGALIPPPTLLAAGFGDEDTALPLRERQRKRAEVEEQIRTTCERFGEPIRDYSGKILGHNHPVEWRQPAEQSPYDGRQSAALKPMIPESPIPEGEKPTRAQFAAWTPSQMRAWLEQHGLWGQDIPSSAFAD